MTPAIAIEWVSRFRVCYFCPTRVICSTSFLSFILFYSLETLLSNRAAFSRPTSRGAGVRCWSGARRIPGDRPARPQSCVPRALTEQKKRACPPRPRTRRAFDRRNHVISARKPRGVPAAPLLPAEPHESDKYFRRRGGQCLCLPSPNVEDSCFGYFPPRAASDGRPGALHKRRHDRSFRNTPRRRGRAFQSRWREASAPGSARLQGPVRPDP